MCSNTQVGSWVWTACIANHVVFVVINADVDEGDGIEALLAEGLACAGVNTLGEVLDDEQLRYRNMIASTADAEGTEYTIPGNPIKITGFPDSPQKPSPPGLDEHGPEIRAKL